MGDKIKVAAKAVGVCRLRLDTGFLF